MFQEQPMISVIRFIITILLVIEFSRAFGQLNYVPPILCETKNVDKFEGVLLLSTVDFHTQLGAPNRYPSGLQIIDPNNPWPPIFFVNAEPGGNGQVGKGYYNNFHFQEATRQFTFFIDLPKPVNSIPLYVICDSNFEPTDTLTSPGRPIDSHDFQINSAGERLYMAVFDTILNLVPFSNDPTDTAVLVTSQLIEIADKNGRVVFRWNPLDYFSVSESYRKFHDLTENNPFTKGWDWQHGNSAGFTSDGNIIYSFRFLGVGKINRNTHEVMWRLGGKTPTIYMPAGGEYLKQHDFNEIGPNLYSLFSNGSKKYPCRAIVYQINEKTNTAKVIRVYEPDSSVYSRSLGNYETNKNGLCIFNYGKYYSLEEWQKMFEIIDTFGRVHASYTSPLLNFAYRVQYVDSWRPNQPIIINDSGTLKVSGNPYSVKWYLIEGTKLKHLSDNVTYKPIVSGIYVATSKAGFGWYVTKPFDF